MDALIGLGVVAVFAAIPAAFLTAWVNDLSERYPTRARTTALFVGMEIGVLAVGALVLLVLA